MSPQLPAFSSTSQRLRFRAGLASRRLLPRVLLPTVIRVRSWIGRRRPGRWDMAVRNARLVLGEGAPQRQVDAVALASAWHATWRQEAYRRPGWANDQQVVGIEHLREALSHGRGCVLSLFHHGDYIGASSALARRDIPVDMVSIPDCFRADASVNLKAAVHSLMSVPGVTLSDVRGGSRMIRERLATGSALMVAVDIAGHTPTHVFEREIDLSSGGLRVAKDLDVPVVVMTSKPPERRFTAATTVLAPALWPHDFTDFESLHSEVVRRLEEAAVAWPEAMHQPDRLFSQGVTRA